MRPRIPPIIVAAISLIIASCGHGDLRGSWSNSKDGNTYLIVAEANCEKCPILVDGKPWKHAVSEVGRINPGVHTIGQNGGEIEFNVPAGTVYKFNYWGP